METNFQSVTVGRLTVEYAVIDRDKFVASAGLSNFLGIDRKVIQNIVRRVPPYAALCKTFEAHDTKGRKQPQLSIPLALLAGILEKVKASKVVRGSAEVTEKANYLLTCLTLLDQKTSAQLFEMREDLLAIIKAEQDEKEVFATRAELSSRVRNARKLKGGYHTKYVNLINGQLQIGE